MHEPVACTLTTKAAAERMVEWDDVRAQVVATVAIDGGARLTLPVALAAGMTDLARRETACCAFLRITTTIDDGQLVVDITSDNPDGLAVIELIAGQSLR